MSIARIRKGDTVVVKSGVDAGKTGPVRAVNPKDGTAIVEKINMRKKAVRRTEQQPGGIIDIEAPIRLCKLMPFDSEAKKGSRVKTGEKDGSKARVLKTSGKTF